MAARNVSLSSIYGYTGRIVVIAEDSVRFAHSGPYQRFLRCLRPLVSVWLMRSSSALKHRSRRPIEPEAVFGQIKYDNHFKRFNYRGKRLVKAEFAAIAVVIYK